MRTFIIAVAVLSLGLVGQAAYPGEGGHRMETKSFSFIAPLAFRKMEQDGTPIDSEVEEYLSEDGNIYLS